MPIAFRAPTLIADATSPPIWGKPDPALADAGVEGESVVASVRVLAMALLLIAPTWNLSQQPDEPMFVTGFAVTFAAAVTSVAIWWWLRRGRWRPWIGFVTSALDVSMVTLALISFFVVASPLMSLNSTVTFEMYFLALVATSLRYDARICLAIGALTIVEYGALWAYGAWRYDLADAAFVAAAGPYLPVDLWTRLLLLAVATVLAVMIVRRAQRLLYLASHDRLTGLFNRAHLDRALVAALESAAREGHELSVAMIDVDLFKQVNDAYGHATGDVVLQRFAALLAQDMRRTDLIARYGGEEFVIILPATNREAAVTRLDVLRQTVTAAEIDVGDGQTLLIGFSAGIAGFPHDAGAIDARTLLEVADQRLLTAKRLGRGRCVGADETASDAAAV